MIQQFKYEIDLPPSRKKTSFNLIDYEYFTIPYANDKIPNSPSCHQIPTQAKQNVWIGAINVDDSITTQGAHDELNGHQTKHGKSKVDISLCIRKSYQRTDLKDIFSRFDLVRSMVSHLEVHLPEKPLTFKKISETLKVPQRQFCNEALFVQYEKNKMSAFFWIP